MTEAAHGQPRVDAEDVAHSREERRTYFGWMRTDVLAVIPTRIRHVLSVGCGAGLTEAELLQRGVEVVGIERDAAAAAAARARGLEVLQGDVGELTSSLAGRRFDCLIYADVLEHLPVPETVLGNHVPLLDPGGVVVISVPNFRHYEVLWRLFAKGNIGYEDAGIFDRTHLRVTTRQLVEQWVRSSGLRVTDVRFIMAQRREKYISALTLGLLREFLSRQVIVIGQKPGAGNQC